LKHTEREREGKGGARAAH
jgi:hypothetical protein